VCVSMCVYVYVHVCVQVHVCVCVCMCVLLASHRVADEEHNRKDGEDDGSSHHARGPSLVHKR